MFASHITGNGEEYAKLKKQMEELREITRKLAEQKTKQNEAEREALRIQREQEREALRIQREQEKYLADLERKKQKQYALEQKEAEQLRQHTAALTAEAKTYNELTAKLKALNIERKKLDINSEEYRNISTQVRFQVS